MGKETEMVRKVEKFRLDIVGLTLMHSQGATSGVGVYPKGQVDTLPPPSGWGLDPDSC